jgi:hypothetical protein
MSETFEELLEIWRGNDFQIYRLEFRRDHPEDQRTDDALLSEWERAHPDEYNRLKAKQMKS